MKTGEQILEQNLEQRITITQQHLRYVTALEKNAEEFDQEVEQELIKNDALEAEDDAGHHEVRVRDFNYAVSQASRDDERPEFAPRDYSATLYDYLRTQLAERRLQDDIAAAASYIIDSLEPDGYLRRSTADLRDDMLYHHGIAVDEALLNEALDVVRDMDPPGVGARDVRDCLLLQIGRLSHSRERDDAFRIVDKKFEALSMKHYHKIISGLKMKEERMRRALDLIQKLNPRPGLAIGDTPESTNIVIPDFVVSEDADTGELTITLNNRIPELQIAESYRIAVKELEETRKKRKKISAENQLILSRYNEAGDFIKIATMRQKTLYTVMSAIVKLQQEYFETGDIYRLRPMMLKNLQQETGLDMSTISRATKNKFVDLPWGTFPLKFFFSDDKGNEDNRLTNRQLEAEIRSIVEGEDKKHPLSDARIYEEMIKRGHPISRRTVTKYRERCGIPISRLRKI